MRPYSPEPHAFAKELQRHGPTSSRRQALRASYAKGSSLDKTVGRYSATVG